MLEQITPIILTYNEIENIERTLNGVKWAQRVIVVDSGSDDGTLEVCQRFSNVEVHFHAFEHHVSQWRYAMSLVEDSAWVMALDADYVISEAMRSELASLQPQGINGYQVGFRYLQNGHPLRATLYPEKIVLHRVAPSHYYHDGHTQAVRVSGKLEKLETKIDHDDRKPWRRWRRSQHYYAALEAQKLRNTRWSELSFNDRIRLVPFLSPLLVLGYTLVYRGLILDGWPGVTYALARTYAETVLSLQRCKLLFNGDG